MCGCVGLESVGGLGLGLEGYILEVSKEGLKVEYNANLGTTTHFI